MYDKLSRIEQYLFDFLSVALVLFYSWSAVFEPAATQYHRGIYVIITYVLVFLIYKSKHLIFRILDYLLMAASVVSVGYWIMNFEAINYRTGIENDTDKAMAMIGVLIGVELARRVVGNIFVLIGVLMLLFGMYGAHMPELVAHAGASFPDLCTSLFYRSDGVFGIMANVLATYIILFVLFGAFLEQCGAQKFFIDFPLAAVGHKIGGPAKVAVIASGLFGSISGSAIANTVSTGTFTIPMMKKAGFKPHVAGAIEPAASIGGMFMPPIMGAGGFIMAEMTGLPYSYIMLVAIFPALMYFFSVFVMVHYEAKKENVVGERYKYSAMEIFRKEWFYILPLVLITVFMLAGYSPGYSAIIGLASCIALSFKGDSKPIDPTILLIMSFMVVCPWLVKLAGMAAGPDVVAAVKPYMSGRILLVYGLVASAIVFVVRRQTLRGMKGEVEGFVVAARMGTINSLKIGATVGVIGIIIGVLTYSGLVLTFADIVIDLADGNLIMTIFLIALASLILGMGVPVTAAYLITAVVAVPALTHLGVNELAAHMIVYWLSQDSNITPPVCIAAFAGATIAGANMWRTAFTSFKFAKFLYLAPFLFAYVPAFSLDASRLEISLWFPAIALAVFAYAWFLSGIWYGPLKRRLLPSAV
ncbi:MAG: TRAP transporter fused permease subunit [Pseudodesulfovibrio sp.]|uniref:TRAP transporter, 4TM/12TM fusion protein n=1 Tax=Pseudodesulfovibrio aespoeensis (strain ATCC 700646 / DSM 10631 / Aspo-2) TaxID=643562 RepID=E6VZB8_PSEA9|nr:MULTISPECIES: TRAP transporter fused permease subunit [Pseudodesulfovibrio]MBU4190836.1 TRAP transporter fused permease subunit [Pseudomonadota bacterium]ADU63990.1 TRAP transporter, 4TM/12TM fusion protein [Pseudodesulfovibrio aespoeensis Aspo-2]MBU4243863.1 TRAP transporter fused permease subunit [Pseudomonadota bacterium]MBU4377510.1 TRAP transporter fused permease subunit [Pseudomonadota bacterium]MBU4475397.1 TRAP transporter fused permease subunit [Pseudomonadota bacterium]